MPLQNRVTPTGDIIATPARGLFTGNRGILHGPDRVMGRARWRHKAWICCVLDWKGVRRQVMTGRNWTELFFLDEATALAAGHRPCAYCRRADYNRFVAAWAKHTGERLLAKQMDHVLHTARIDPATRKQRVTQAHCSDLPPGAFVNVHGKPHLWAAGHLWPWHPSGYGAALAPPAASVTVLTPPPLLTVLRAGYVPKHHPSAEI